MTIPRRPYFNPGDLLYGGVALMAEDDFRDFESAIADIAASHQGIDTLFDYVRTSMCQRSWYRPGTCHDFNRLCTAFGASRVAFPSVRMARSVFDDLRDRLRRYTFDAEGERWWIRVNYEGDFGTPFNAERWVLRNGWGGKTIRLDRSVLPRALGLFSLLNGQNDWSGVEAYVRGDAGSRALLDLLLEGGCLVESEPAEFDLREVPELLFLNHSSVLVRSDTTMVVFDPCIGAFAAGYADPRRNPFMLLNRADAVFITHHHWDHMPWTTLVRLRRDMPIYVPKLTHPSFINVPIEPYLRFLGFEHVYEVAVGETIRVGDVIVEAHPFHGESFGLQSVFDAFTFFVEFGGRTLYASVDACHNERGRMDPVMAELARRRRVDIFLFGSSDQMHLAPVRAAGPRHLSNELIDRPDLLRYHPNVVDVERWTALLSPRVIIPYAQFVFDGQRAPDIRIDAPESLDATFNEYWKEFRAEDAGAGGAGDPRREMRIWHSQLTTLRRVIEPPLVMLQPMQGARL